MKAAEASLSPLTPVIAPAVEAVPDDTTASTAALNEAAVEPSLSSAFSLKEVFGENKSALNQHNKKHSKQTNNVAFKEISSNENICSPEKQ